MRIHTIRIPGGITDPFVVKTYDDTARERVQEAIYVLNRENVAVFAVAMGVRAYWSLRAWLLTRPFVLNDHPDRVDLIADGANEEKITTYNGVPICLDPYAPEDSVRPLCGPEGTHLAFDAKR